MKQQNTGDNAPLKCMLVFISVLHVTEIKIGFLTRLLFFKPLIFLHFFIVRKYIAFPRLSMTHTLTSRLS